MTTKQFAVAAVLLGLGFATASDAEAQQRKRYALFISGYGSSVWEQSGTPQDWKRRGIVDDYAILDAVVEDKLEELKDLNISGVSDLRSLIGQTNADSVRVKLTKLYINAPGYANTDLIIVGHSAGGYLARALGALIETYGVDIASYGPWRPSVSVVTFATPHQGARIGNKTGAGIREPLVQFIDRVRAPLGDRHRVVTWVVDGRDHTFGRLWMPFLGMAEGKTFQLNDIRALSGQLAAARDQLLIKTGEYDGQNFVIPYRKAVQPGAPLIGALNRLADPENFLSVYGAEKSKVVVRLASDVPQAGLDGDEEGAYGQYAQLRKLYKANQVAWNVSLAAAPVWGVIRGYRKKANRWGEGLKALDRIDDTWARTIDSYTTTRRTGYRRTQVCIPQDGGRGPLDPATPIAYRLQTRMRECARGESAYRYTPYSYTVTVETKNDGVMGPQYGVWDKAQMARYATDVTVARRNGNLYMGDTGDSGGYNHMELRRSKRAYSKSGVFSKGDANPPVEKTERWMRERLRF